MKKVFTAFLVIAMLFAFSGCTAQPSSGGKGKIAIITGTTSQGEEEFRAAEDMKAKYGDRIVTATYPDNFTKETETTISTVKNLVSDPEVKALIFVQAVPGATAAVQQALEINPNLLIIAGVPGEDPGVMAPNFDFLLSADEIDGMGNAIPEQAKALGAKVFVHYSFARHMSYPTLAARRDLFKAKCAEIGLQFVDATAPDPTGDAGVPGAQQFIIEDTPKMVAKYGKDTAFFSTNCAMQEPLIKAVLDAGAIYPQPCCPSPFHGFPGALGISAENANTPEAMIAAVTAAIAEKGMSGRLSTWPVPINKAMIEGATLYAIEYVDGKIKEKSNMEELARCLKTATGATMTIGTLTEGGVNYPNYYTLLSEFVTF